jgi:hypothetical protein
MAVIVALFTVNVKIPDRLPTVAVKIAVPGAIPVTRFGLAAVIKLATEVEALVKTA